MSQQEDVICMTKCHSVSLHEMTLARYKPKDGQSGQVLWNRAGASHCKGGCQSHLQSGTRLKKARGCDRSIRLIRKPGIWAHDCNLSETEDPEPFSFMQTLNRIEI